MNSSVQIYRRLLTLRSCKKIISSRYCDDRKCDGKVDGNEPPSDDSTGPQSDVKEKTELVKNKILSSAEGPATSTKTVGEWEKEKLSTIKHVQKNERSAVCVVFSTTKEERESVNKTRRMNLMRSSDSPDGNETSGSIKFFFNKKVEEDGFLAAYKKQEEILNKKIEEEKLASQKSETFAAMLRKSPFVDLGDPVGKVVVGKIYLVVENDLYIDFGWKFHTVCPKPKKNPEKYIPGGTVLLKINDLELNAKFLGSKKYISLLEADCILIGSLPKEWMDQLNE